MFNNLHSQAKLFLAAEIGKQAATIPDPDFFIFKVLSDMFVKEFLEGQKWISENAKKSKYDSKSQASSSPERVILHYE